MSPPKSAVDLDLIAAHAPYVRVLARELVFDAELAKDVEQDVLLAALENAPRDPRSIKGWLASIVRHLASKAFRARARRAERESAVSSEPVPTPAEILAREDQRRALIEHVLALDEPVRAVMLLRFFEELPPREVARRLGIPVETVRTRAKRGVELLRARLEREPGRGGGAWCLALITGLKIQPPSLLLAGASVLGASLTGVIAMGVSKKVAVVVAILALASTTWIVLERREPAWPRKEPVSAAAEPSEVQAATAEAPVPSSSGAEGRTALSIPPTPRPASAAPTTGSVLLTVHWFDGTPAGGVNAWIYRSRDDFYADAFDVAIGADGTHVIAALDPGELSISLDRGPDGRCEVVAGERAEVEITIPRGFDVSGRVVERGGRAFAGAEILLDKSYGGRSGHVVAHSDANGHFEIRSVEKGMALVSARAPLHAPSAQRSLIGASTGFENVELVLDPAGAALEGVVYDSDDRPLPRARVLIGPEETFRVVFFDDGGRGLEPAAQVVLCDDRGRFDVAGVPLGRIPVKACAKGHSPWSGEVETLDQRTARLDIHLVRGTTLTGRVTAGSDAPVAHADVHGNGNGGARFVARYSRTAADGSFTMRDLPAGEFQVSIEADGFEKAETTLTGSPGAQLTWNPVLGSGLSIRGRLVMPGTDFSEWYVQCESQDWQKSPLTADVRPNAEGVFEIRGCVDVAYTIEVHAPNGNWMFPIAKREDVHPGGPELVLAIEPSSLPSCTLRGRIVDDNGQPLPGVEYMVFREGGNAVPILSAASDGTFEVGSLPPGKYVIAVQVAGFAPGGSGEGVDVTAGSTWDFGDVRLQRGGTLAVRLTRDPALAQAVLTVSALQPTSGNAEWLPVLGDEAHSRVLLPGDYVVQVRGRNDGDAIAQRSVHATVRTGEKTSVELRVDSGARISIVFEPSDVVAADVRALDAGGDVLWEERVRQNASVVVPRSAVRLTARDDAGRTAEVAVAAGAGLATQVVTIGLK